ncbi:MAG: phage tail protein [Anaerolineae bacterium]
MADREDPLVAFKFGLEIEGKLAGYFQTVSGIGSESEIIEHKIVDDNTGETINQKIPGRLTWTDVTLKRGVTSNIDVWEWRQEVVDGKVDDARTNCSIVAYNQTNDEVARWNLENAWPSKIAGPEMDSGGTDLMVEEMTIVHEGLERVT